MMRWRQGADRIEMLLHRGELQAVSGGADSAIALLDMAKHHVKAAEVAMTVDLEGAFALAYDAVRKAGTALLAHQGLRPTTRGGHIAVADAIAAQFPSVPGLKSLDRLRRRRNETEYPDPAGYDPITADEALEGITAARAAVDAARALIDRPELGLFRP